MNIGIIGGSFDPIHYGHIGMAMACLKSKMIDKVLLMPNGNPPHKDNCTPIYHRIEMVKRAIKAYNNIYLEDFEENNKEPNYTIDTFKILKIKYHPNNVFLIMGFDSFRNLYTWKDYKELISLAKFLILDRENGSIDEFIKLKNLYECEAFLVPMEKINISSSDIRSRYKNGTDCEGLIPNEVIDYIKSEGVYND
jgi:nicotinate-nucleotide adenylyltransferase